MLRISKLTDYAVVVLASMGRGRETRTVGEIAEDTGVPSPTVAKLMKPLTAAGIVVSQRGANGGYALHRALAGVSVAEVVTALEGPIAVTDCVSPEDGACGTGALCPMRGNWSRINDAVREALESVSLAEMATPMWETEPSLARPMTGEGQ